MDRSLRVLVTNLTLAGHRGARSVTRDLAIGLLRAGHRPMVYTRTLGPLADELRRQSIPVTDDIAMIAETPDIIHGQHFSVATLAVTRFPDVPAIFVCHDFVAWHDSPPRLPQIRRWAAISEAFRERLTVEGGIDPATARVVLNAVDLDRYRPGPPLARRPRRALAFAKNVDHLPAVREACAEAGVELEVVGGAVGKVVAPEEILGGFDVVFASALTAIEAMASGRAVVVCDGRGLAGMVDPQRYAAWRPENFGLRTLLQPLSAAAMGAELARYDRRSARQVSKAVRAEAGLPAWIGAWEALYREAIADHRDHPLDPERAARDMAAQLQAWSSHAGPGFPWMIERAQLIDQALGGGLQSLKAGQATTADDPRYVQLNGFMPKAGAVWSTRPVCAIGVRVERDVKQLAFAYGLRFGTGRERFDFEVWGNGLPLADWSDVFGDGPWTHTLDIPSDLIGADGRLWLTFSTSAPLAPAKAQGDARPLGFGLTSVSAQ